ncbi:hypothetical protein [Hymenobacter sp. B81]|uniref:hypothetical protein n=1 Tax=Hymenobacter sp. B81 TaxID=3344878 RepID=UPI0037DDCFE3
MKTHVLALLAFAALGGACQRHTEGDRATVSAVHTRPAVERRPAEARPEPRPALVPVPAAPAAPAPQLTADMRALLRDYDLSPLWQTPVENGRSLDGFFGADHYRLELVLLAVRKDSLRPELYHIQGKNRFKKRITPFAGTLTLHQLQDLPLEREEAGEDARAYTATGTFELRENPGRAGAGRFAGTVATDFRLQPSAQGGLQLWYGTGTDHSPTQGSGFKFEGQWTAYQGGAGKPCVWADQFLVIGSSVLKDFVVGERDVNINPRYAKLGWDTYWENDEWWATAPATARR